MSTSPISPATSIVEQRIVEVVSRIGQTHFPARLAALILTGSTSRGESSIQADGNRAIVLGDVEFVVVTNDGTSIEGFTSSIEYALKQNSIDCAVSAMLCTQEELSSLPPTVFTFELRACGKVLVGDPAILSTIRSFSKDELPLEDAWRLICNRSVELMETLASSKGKADVLANEAVGYKVLKLYLDICTSLLIFSGEYEPTYQGRARRLSQVLPSLSHQLQHDLSDFDGNVEEALLAKLTGEGAAQFADPGRIKNALLYCQLASNWELRKMSEKQPPTIESYARSRSFLSRARGWLAVATRSDFLNASVQSIRWLSLSLKGSPRHLIYKATADLLKGWDSPSIDERVLASANQLLPYPSKGSLTWSSTAAAVAENYHRFVEVTRS
jgi:hypothetical protein